jgi:hypothetical protein
MLYKIQKGTSKNKSFGINIAKIVRFPKKVIENAKKKMKELELMGGEMEEEMGVIMEKEKERENKSKNGDNGENGQVSLSPLDSLSLSPSLSDPSFSDPNIDSSPSDLNEVPPFVMNFLVGTNLETMEREGGMIDKKKFEMFVNKCVETM